MNTPAITFQIADTAQLPLIVGTYNASIKDKIATADLIPITVESRADWFLKHHKKRPIYLVCYQNKYAGWLSFSDFYGRPAYNQTAEVSIYIEPSMQKKGIGALCLQFALSQCKKIDINILLGFIFAHNAPSLKLFYAHGFEKWGHLPQVANMQGALRDLIIVGKKIE
ncbi:MAG: N-acetyltransferase [Bacteroidetes bacterium]|nr:N-acetyltransferase [Bacteroidota bacterium]